MAERTRLDNGQMVGAGLSIFDKKGQLIEEGNLPAGSTVVFTNDNEAAAQFVQNGENSMNGKVTTEGDKVGVSNITGTVTFADGSTKSDILEVTVVNSAPDTARFTVGTPEDEAPPPAP
jgi:hypothetical protein